MGKAKKAVKKITGGGDEKKKAVSSSIIDNQRNADAGSMAAIDDIGNATMVSGQNGSTMLTSGDDANYMLTEDNKKKRSLLGA